METVIRKLNKKEIKNLGNEFQFIIENDYSKMYYKKETLIDLRDKINNALSERQTSTEVAKQSETKALHIADVVRSFPMKAKHNSFGEIEIIGIMIDDVTYHQTRYYARMLNGYFWVYDYDVEF